MHSACYSLQFFSKGWKRWDFASPWLENRAGGSATDESSEPKASRCPSNSEGLDWEHVQQPGDATQDGFQTDEYEPSEAVPF